MEKEPQYWFWDFAKSKSILIRKNHSHKINRYSKIGNFIVAIFKCFVIQIKTRLTFLLRNICSLLYSESKPPNFSSTPHCILTYVMKIKTQKVQIQAKVQRKREKVPYAEIFHNRAGIFHCNKHGFRKIPLKERQILVAKLSTCIIEIFPVEG